MAIHTVLWMLMALFSLGLGTATQTLFSWIPVSLSFSQLGRPFVQSQAHAQV
jgi:hypothetical protein